MSSSPAPAGYGKGLAALYAYQPIEYEDPANWSGQQLTGGSWYTNPSHPIAAATNADAPLLYFTQAYPPHWDGLVEIRMYFTAVGVPPESTSYPAAIVRVQGNSWSLVSGGNVACNAGEATALETKTLPASRLANPASVALVAPGTKAGDKTSATTLAGGSRSRSASTSAPTSGAGQAAIGAPSSDSNGGGLSGLGIALITLAGLLSMGVASAVWFLCRRRHAEVST